MWPNKMREAEDSIAFCGRRPVKTVLDPGINLNNPLDLDQLDTVYQAVLDHKVIFFRDQDITPAAHLAFAQSFGELDAPHPAHKHVEGFDRIVMLANGAGNPPNADCWQTDLTFRVSGFCFGSGRA